MNDMVKVTEPKSDQWNFDDFQSGSRTFTITNVKVKTGQEQPVEISLEGTEKYYRPCKSMARVLVSAWGADSSKYVGRSMTLYGDAAVKWGGLAVGGIRISHMSHIDSALTLALTVTRANKKPYTVKPLVAKQSRNWTAELQSAATLDDLVAIWKQIPASDKPSYLTVKDARKVELTPPAFIAAPTDEEGL